MNKFLFFVAVLLYAGVCPGVCGGMDLAGRLGAVPGVVSVEEGIDTVCGKFYRCLIKQPCDHERPDGGFFYQRFCLFYQSDSAAVVVVTTGGGLDSLCRSEAAVLLKANQVVVETRYCGESVPEGGVDWNTLTMKQVAADVHCVTEGLKTVFPRNYFVSAGRGQGGLEALFHRRYYPQDVEQTILYNTPFCMGAPDKRVTRHQIRLGKPPRRFQGRGINLGANGGSFAFFPTFNELNYDIKDFQRYCFRHQDSLLPLFEAYGKERGMSFERVGSSLRALLLTVLEYRPAFFYRAVSRELIPYKDFDDPKLYFEHLVSVADPALFCDSSVVAREPLAWLALNETGSYEHFVRPYRGMLPKDISDRSYLYATDMPVAAAEFRQGQMKELAKWVQREAKGILFVYGLLDVYSVAKVNLRRNGSCTLLVDPGQGYDCRMMGFDRVTCSYLEDMLVSAHRDYRRLLRKREQGEER